MPPADTDSFAKRKAIGDTAEAALCRLLTHHGCIVEAHQQNRDATHPHAGAAVAHLAGGSVYLPDLSVTWPLHPIRRFGAEVKAKSPLHHGGYGWDTRAFNRALRWSLVSGDPVLYIVRNRDAAPLPPAGILDDPDHWHVASCWKLVHSSERATDEPYHYWPAEVFTPLTALLHGAPERFQMALVPIIPNGIGLAPLVL